MTRRPRLHTGHVLAFLWLWSILSTAAVLGIALRWGNPVFRAVILMGSGLVFFWVAAGGLLTFRYRDSAARVMRRIPLPSGVKFVLFATALALLEEAVTVTMTNAAPLFGVRVGQAYITASASYLDVVALHSVVVFVPMFAAWAWMLRRWAFHPNAVFLLFGITGMLAEVQFGGLQAFAMFATWICVYGLMVYLPAYAYERPSPVPAPPWWRYPVAVLLPFLFGIPVAGVVSVIHPVKIHFPPIQADLGEAPGRRAYGNPPMRRYLASADDLAQAGRMQSA